MPEPHRARRSRAPARQVRHARLPSGSRARCSRTRCCRWRSSAPASPTAAPTRRTSCWRSGTRQRRSLLTSRQHLLNEAEALLAELPLELREQLPDSKAVRPRLARARAPRPPAPRATPPTRCGSAARRLPRNRSRASTPTSSAVSRELAALVSQPAPRSIELCGLSTRSVAELLVEAGDPRRFTDAGFARFNGTAPIPASTAEGPGEPVRHRYNPGGNRRVNAILHRMAVTQLRCEPRAQALYDRARARGHTKREARRILKRHLSDVVHRTMLADLTNQPT